MKVIPNTPQFVLLTNEFGFNLMISDPEKTNLPATDEISEAMMFLVGYDNAELKRKYWSAITGYNLNVVFINDITL